jgi:hypothetical protein
MISILKRHQELVPLFGIFTTAMVGCSGFSIYKLTCDPSVLVSKKKRQEILKN